MEQPYYNMVYLFELAKLYCVVVPYLRRPIKFSVKIVLFYWCKLTAYPLAASVLSQYCILEESLCFV